MGWTYFQRHGKGSVIDTLKANGVFTWSNCEPWQYTVLDSAFVRLSVLYVAVEKKNLETGERHVWAAVILIDLKKKKDGYNFGYKDMDETMGPCEDDCPERILKLLTPTESEYAKDWRERCWKNLRARKDRPKIEPGCVVVLFDKEYTITGTLGRKGYRMQGTSGQDYRLPLSYIRKLSEIRPKQ